jgi:four helix bundle protein
MNDASLSVMFNIAEGFLRRRDKETLQFLRYAFASNGELKSAYHAAEGRSYLSAPEGAELIGLNESIAKMLRRWQAKDDG